MSSPEERKAILKKAVNLGVDEFLTDYTPPSFHTIVNGLDAYCAYLIRHAYRLTMEANKPEGVRNETSDLA